MDSDDEVMNTKYEMSKMEWNAPPVQEAHLFIFCHIRFVQKTHNVQVSSLNVASLCSPNHHHLLTICRHYTIYSLRNKNHRHQHTDTTTTHYYIYIWVSCNLFFSLQIFKQKKP